MSELKMLSLFDGSGGFPLAASLCGIRPVACSEVEPYPIAVTRSRFPGMKHLGDISKINGAEVEPVDVITFGSPCQDLSVAGKRAGLKHEANGDDETTRSGLFMEAIRIIKEMREATHGKYPSFALWENVPGAFSSNKGEDFRVVLEELIKIVEPSCTVPAPDKNGWPYADCYVGDGWSLAYRVFDAQFWGVPQRRRRIHLVLDLRGERAEKVLFEREGLRGYFAESGTPWQATAGDASGGSGADDREGAKRSNGAGGQIAACLYAAYGTKWNGNGGAYSGENFVLEQSFDRDGDSNCLTPWDVQSRRIFTADGSWPALYSGEGGGHGYVCYQNGDIDAHILDDQGGSCINVRTDGKSPTLRAEMHGNVPMVMEGHPVYCLQGNGIDRADTAGCNGKGWKEDTCYTLNTIDRPAVAYGVETFHCNHEEEKVPTLKARDWKDPNVVIQPIAIDRAYFNQGQNALYDPALYEDGTNPTLVARGPNAVCVRYIVRRLTPTECARLQGFADRWGDITPKSDFSDEEYSFWLDVRNTHARINGKAEKEHTKAQMLTWYNKLLTDSAEYKMWGNGIALPPALYCMQGIVDALQEVDAK